MIKQITVCDICGKQKQLCNHWFKATATKGSDEIVAGFSLYPAGEELWQTVTYQDLCGSECAIKALNNWMQEQMSAVQDTQKTTEAKA